MASQNIFPCTTFLITITAPQPNHDSLLFTSIQPALENNPILRLQCELCLSLASAFLAETYDDLELPKKADHAYAQENNIAIAE